MLAAGDSGCRSMGEQNLADGADQPGHVLPLSH